MTGIFIGIGGGTASGKTTLAAALALKLPKDQVQVVSLDWYYRNNPHLSEAERAQINYDHPDAFDYDLLKQHLSGLKERGQPTQAPSYDFATHLRGSSTYELLPDRVTIVEGILALYWPEILRFLDYKVFVDSKESVRLSRRLNRDVRERGRTPDSVITQWHATVSPMYDQFCAPTKKSADLVVDGEALLPVLVDSVESKLRELKLPSLD